MELTAKVKRYRLCKPDGEFVRFASEVRFSDGFTIQLTEDYSKRNAIKLAIEARKKLQGL